VQHSDDKRELTEKEMHKKRSRLPVHLKQKARPSHWCRALQSADLQTRQARTLLEHK